MTKAISRRLALGLLLIAVGGGAYYWLSAERATAPVPARSGAARAVPVDVAQVTARQVPVTIRTIGTMQASSTVAVRSRVDGQILDAAFAEGQWVSKDQPLFHLDARPFDARLREAEANLARDQAALDKAKGDFQRYQSLSDKGYSSQQKYEEARAAMNGMTATLRADQAAIDLARLNLEYTTIRAPIAGRTGSILVDAGNLVKASDAQPLVVINATAPILATFAVAERFLVEIKQRLAESQVEVEAAVPEGGRQPVPGRLVFINNAVDTQTGTIQLKAEFTNADGVLTPGQFVQIAIQMRTIEGARVVPERSLQEGRDGTYVFVVHPDDTVEPMTVTPGPSVDGFVSIGDALPVGQTVVTDGQMRLFKGAKVSFKAVRGDGAAAGKVAEDGQGADKAARQE